MADKYWWPSGGTGTSTGNWSSTTNWSSSSASYISTTAPTSADNANFGSYSGATSFTVTVTTGSLCLALVINNANMTLAGSGTWSIYGAVTVTSFASRTYTGALTFAATTSVALNFGTMTFASAVNFNGTGGTWTLASAFNDGASSITLTAGTLNTAGFTVTCGTFNQSGTTTRALNLGASTINLSVNWTATATNLTFNAGTSTIQLSSSAPTFDGGGLTYNNVSFTSGAVTIITIPSTGTFNNLTFASRSSVGISIVVLSANQTITGTFTIPAPTTLGASRYQVLSATLGTTRTITAAAVNLTDVDFQDITGAGAATWSGTRLGDCKGNSGITFPAAKTVYWNLAGSNNWSATGWATTQTGTPATTNFPLAQDTAIFTDTNPASGNTITINATYSLGTIDFSLRTVALTVASSTSLYVYGSTTLSSAITMSGSATWTYASRGGTQVIISAGRTWTQPLTVSSIGGTVQLGDACTRSGVATVTSGTLDLNNYALTCTTFSSSAFNTRTLAFGASGSITVTGTGTVFNTSSTTGLTISGTNPIVNVTNATATATTVTTGTTVGVSNLLSFNFTAGTYTLTTTASNLFKSLNFTGFAGALANTARSIYGDLTVSTGMTLTAGANQTTFAGTSGTQIITTNGKTFGFSVGFNGVGGTFVLNDSFQSSATLQLSNGTLNLNGYTYTTANVNTNAGTKNITFNGGTIVCTISGIGAFQNASPTGFTTTAGTGTGTISLTSASAKTFIGGGSTYNCTLNQGGAGALTISGANTFNNITNSVQPTTITFTIALSNKQTFLDFNVNGTAGNLVTINSSSAGSVAYISKASGTVSVDYLSIQDSTATGGASWYAGANSTDVSNNTGWIFSAVPVNVTVSPTTQNAAFTLRSVAISAATTQSTTGQNLTATPHSVTASAAATSSVTGQALTFTQHNVTASCEYTASVSGQNLNMAEHSVALLLGADVAVTGQTLYFAQHDVSLITDHVLPVTGQAITFADHAITIRCDYDAAIIGQNLFTAEHSVALSTEQVMQAAHQNIQSAVHGPKFWFPIDENQNANWGAINVTQTANWTTIDASQTPDWTDVET